MRIDSNNKAVPHTNTDLLGTRAAVIANSDPFAARAGRHTTRTTAVQSFVNQDTLPYTLVTAPAGRCTLGVAHHAVDLPGLAVGYPTLNLGYGAG